MPYWAAASELFELVIGELILSVIGVGTPPN
jgi:hypothetical protein